MVRCVTVTRDISHGCKFCPKRYREDIFFFVSFRSNQRRERRKNEKNIRHLYQNFQNNGYKGEKLTTLLWQAAKAYKYSHWKSKVDLVSPIRLRDPGRPCVRRKKSWMEKNKQSKPRHCSTCGGDDHNSRTCKGGPVGSNPKKKRANGTAAPLTSATKATSSTGSKRKANGTAAPSTSTTPSTSVSKKVTTAPTTSSAGGAGSSLAAEHFPDQQISCAVQQSVHRKPFGMPCILYMTRGRIW
ncbi:hypothetical protein C5167_005573 [Papaver somniferum]|uniref:CCHC-type domain-containing protein n=1 Tax=Papaver somniferum TaxID=3469 RepID=A0A4Y7JAV5_PAPSO|nr:hypothetical protein C5167_005573 [Papaver somniferum]